MHTITSEIQPARKPSTVTIHAPGEGQAIWFLDNLATVKASGSDGARFGLMESALPAGSETPFHRHQRDDESFYVLEGVLTLFLEGGRVVDLGAGSFVRTPAGTAHGFRTKTAVRMLVVSDPDGFVDFVRDFGVPAPRRELPPATPQDLPRLVSTAERHRIELLGPLPE